MFRVNNRNTATRFETCSKLTPCSTVSIINFDQVNAFWLVCVMPFIYVRRCGNVAAILELNEHLKRDFTIFEAAPPV